MNGSRKKGGLILVKQESKEVVLPVINKFKGRNQAWPKTVVIMSGKIFYRTVLVFPRQNC